MQELYDNLNQFSKNINAIHGSYSKFITYLLGSKDKFIFTDKISIFVKTFVYDSVILAKLIKQKKIEYNDYYFFCLCFVLSNNFAGVYQNGTTMKLVSLYRFLQNQDLIDLNSKFPLTPRSKIRHSIFSLFLFYEKYDYFKLFVLENKNLEFNYDEIYMNSDGVNCSLTKYVITLVLEHKKRFDDKVTEHLENGNFFLDFGEYKIPEKFNDLVKFLLRYNLYKLDEGFEMSFDIS